MAEIDGLLRIMTERGSSDLHVKVGNSPALRLNGRLVVLHDLPVLNPEQTYALAVGMMNEPQRAAFDGSNEADFAYSLSGVGRFRVNVFHQRGTVGMTLRRVATERSSVAELGLPPVISQLADESRGLILVTGTAGSGKTTTLASMIDHINSTREGHIVTIEDPIEVLHQDKKCIVNQREIGIDTDSYEEALRHVVLSTLHTIDATETINRIIDFFPPYQQKQIRLMLAATLRGIISMRLIPSMQGGLVPAVEVLVMTGLIREYVTDSDKTYLIRDAIEGGGYDGMVTFDQSLLRLYQDRKITLDDAIAMAHNAHDFKIKVRSLGVDPAAAAQTGIY